MCFLEIRNESDVFIEIVGVFVVCGVGDAPGVEGHEEETVDDKSRDVVEEFGFRESAVAAFVGDFPEACKDKSLEEGVECPSTELDVGIWDLGDESGEKY